MLRYALTRAALLCASLAGAAIFAAAIAALSVPGAHASSSAFALALADKVPAVFSLDLGLSKISGFPAGTDAAVALRASLEVLLPALFVAGIVGTGLGVLLSHEIARLAVAPIVQMAGSIPLFSAAIALALLFGTGPSGIANPPSLFAAFLSPQPGAIAAALATMAPIILTVGLAGAGAVALSVSSALERALSEPYGEALRRFGLSRGEILRVFVARHAFALTLKDAGDIVFSLFAAAAVAEWVFTWPGAGAAFIHAVALEDWTMVAVFVFVVAMVRFSFEFLGVIAARALLGHDPPP